MSSEIIDFYIKTYIKDKSNQIKELKKRVGLKIYWKTNKWGTTRGLLNPEWYKYIRQDGRHDPEMDGWKGKGKVIQFEKDGQKYDILVEFTVKKGWFRDSVMDKSFSVFPSDYSNARTPDSPFTCGTGYDRDVKNQMKHSVIPAKRRKEGYILGGIIVVLITAFLFFIVWKKWKKEKFKRKR